MIRFTDTLTGISEAMLEGFFEGWPDPPSPATHLRILRSSAHVVLAVDDQAGRVVGFINAISDGIMCAYIPLLEVLPEYRGRGIGSELTERMLRRLGDLYMVDLMCDPSVLGFYETRGMKPAQGAVVRNFDRQSCGARS